MSMRLLLYCGMTKIDFKDAILGVELEEWNEIYKGVLKARDRAKVARLAANPKKKQAAIEETEKTLNELLNIFQ